MNPRVEKVSVLCNHRLQLGFTNGEERVFDCTPYLEQGVFRELKDPQYFAKVTALDGTVVWPHEQDFCPDTLYLNSMNAEQAAAAGAPLRAAER